MPGKYEKPKRGRKFPLIPVILTMILILALAGLSCLGWRHFGPQHAPEASAPETVPVTLPPETTLPTETTLPEPEHVVTTATIAAQGDMLMHGPIFDKNSLACQSDGSYDFSSIFRYFSDYTTAPDWMVANLETTLAGDRLPYSGYPNFNCPDDFIDTLASVGFDMLLTANNHSYDTVMEGFLRTVEVVRDRELIALGSRLTEEEPRYVTEDINGIRVGMVCYTYTTSMDGGKPRLNGNSPVKDPALVNYFSYQNLDGFYAEVEEIREKMEEDGAEATVFFIHWGEEYEIQENDRQRNIAQKLCDLNFDVIVGAHPHVVQPVSLLTSTVDPSRSTVCVYSLGNAVSNQRRERMNLNTGHTEDGAYFSVTFEKYSDGTVYLAEAKLLPTWVRLRQASGGAEYNILPLEDSSREQWQAMFELTDGDYDRAIKSYERTQAIVGEGMETVERFLARQKERRDEDYLAAVTPDAA